MRKDVKPGEPKVNEISQAIGEIIDRCRKTETTVITPTYHKGHTI